MSRCMSCSGFYSAPVFNGLDLGEMQKKQMQQIEELTLLLIRQQHEIDSLKILIRGKLMIKENPATMK